MEKLKKKKKENERRIKWNVYERWIYKDKICIANGTVPIDKGWQQKGNFPNNNQKNSTFTCIEYDIPDSR